jgi:hypothetical protein
MKSAIIFFTIALSLIWNVRETFAAGSIGARSVALTSLEPCPGYTFEFLFEQGNSYNARALLTIICMWPEANQVRWVIKAGAECELSPRANGLCKGDVPLSLVSEATYHANLAMQQRGFISHNYHFKKGVIGRSCNVTSITASNTFPPSYSEHDFAWDCDEYEQLNDTYLYTVGTNGLALIVEQDGNWRFEDNFLHFSTTHNIPDPYIGIIGVPSRYYVSNP